MKTKEEIFAEFEKGNTCSDCKQKIFKGEINTDVSGTHLQGTFTLPTIEVENLFGKYLESPDGDKIDIEWRVITPFGIATIYNWKNGKNYLGEDGIDIEKMNDWNVGGHNRRNVRLYPWNNKSLQGE